MASTAPSGTVTDIEQCAAKSSPTTKPTDIKDCDVETHDHLTSSPISEPQIAPAASPQYHTTDPVGENTQKNNRPFVITVAGMSGVGKSTMINKLLGLEGEQRCATGDDADPTTRDSEVKICSNTRYDTEITLKIVDTPGLGGLTERREVYTEILKNISKRTDETADILLYCISLHPSRRIEGYTRNFQSALRTANIFGVQVRSILTGEELPKGTIPAVPIGDDPNTPLVVGDDWTDALLDEVLKRTDCETALNFK